MRPAALPLLAAAACLCVPAWAEKASSAPPVHDLCPTVRFIGAAPTLSEVEKRLVCGDPDSVGWRTIPLPQAEQFMTAFLQQRGYHFPRFRARDGRLDVEVGTSTVVTKLTTDGTGEIFDLSKRRGIVGQLLTPSLLDKVKKAAVFEFQSRGYACPRVEVSADARTGEVHVAADPELFYRIRHVPGPELKGLDPAVFGRYDAFQDGDPLDIRLLELTSARIRQDALFLSAFYDLVCATDSLHVTQRVVEGPPRLITLGLGADTEGLVQGRAQWRDTRIGYRASQIQATAFASEREQSLDAFMDYYLRPADRIHLRPAAFFRREYEVQYQAVHAEASLQPEWTHDGTDLRVRARGGPAVDYFNTITGLGPSRARWFQFTTHSDVMTHLYEYYETDPRRGWMASLDTMSRVRGAYSDVTAHRVTAQGESLWNLGNYEPPLLVLATRGLAGVTWLPDRQLAFSKLPPTDRFFLGGDADIRGFNRKSLPGDGTGFLSTLYQGLELRAGDDVLPYNLQPLVFIDAAMGSPRDFHLDPDVYYAPGFGIRWAAPFGSLRATLARGLTWRRGSLAAPPRPHWQFFFSFGKEF